MTQVNHWGKWVDSEIPVPGVISANKINWEYLDNEICLGCEEAEKEIEEMQECPNCEITLNEEDYCPKCGWNKESEYEYVECSDHTKLFGDWKKDENGKYYPDETGEFAAIYTQGSFNDFTVIWSKFVKKNVALCSPCAPGQASIDSVGEFSCYDLPKYLTEEEEDDSYGYKDQKNFD